MLLIVINWTLSLIFICNLKYSIHKESSIVFHNESNYEYYLIIKEIAEELETQFTCFGENTEEYIAFEFQYRKKLQDLIKMEKELQNPYLTN